MNLLAADIGNSQITYGHFLNGELTDIQHNNIKDVEAAACNILKAAAGDIVVLCSVVPEAANHIEDYLKVHGCQPLSFSATSQKLITGVYDSMGADRVANAAAAWRLYCHESSAVVLDFGTATTLTAVSHEGRFLGGLITLGLGQTLAQLAQHLAQLPSVNIDRSPNLTLAFNTERAIVNGAISAHLGIICEWVRLANEELKHDTIVIATGGWSQALAHHTRLFDVVEPYLTLKGIYLIAEAEIALTNPG